MVVIRTKTLSEPNRLIIKRSKISIKNGLEKKLHERFHFQFTRIDL